MKGNNEVLIRKGVKKLASDQECINGVLNGLISKK